MKNVLFILKVIAKKSGIYYVCENITMNASRSEDLRRKICGENLK